MAGRALPDSSERYYEYVIDQIKAMIMRGDLKCGDRLPSERELALRFNVSRVPIREAIKILEYTGVLDCSQGSGTYVKNLPAEELLTKTSTSSVVTRHTVEQFLAVRIELEGFAAYLAAKNRTQEDLDAMRRTLQEVKYMRARVNSGEEDLMSELREKSQAIHYQIILAAHNEVLQGIYDNLHNLLEVSRQMTVHSGGAVSNNSILAHQAIFDKIERGDAAGAREMMSLHLTDIKLSVEKSE
ncbi:MAG: FadR family transcriptional regulator [Clostridia bacterium]|nr:FadR family transcriptional regulator [Clostridia bacterium]